MPRYTYQAVESLKTELFDALLKDATQIVRTPGFGRSSMTAAEVVADDFAGEGGDARFSALLKIAAKAPEFAAWADEMAQRHAEFHAEDLDEEEPEWPHREAA